MRYLISGAAGFIGFHIAKRLLEAGHEVSGIDNINDYYDPKLKYARLALLEEFDKFAFHKHDLIDGLFVTQLIADTHPDRVIHLAAQAGVRYSIENPHAYIQSNIIGFLNILEACKTAQTPHLTYASSSSVYGANTNIPFSSKRGVDHPLSMYAATKKAIRNELPLQAGDVPNTWADCSELAKDFDYAPATTIDVGIAKFIEWYRDYYKA